MLFSKDKKTIIGAIHLPNTTIDGNFEVARVNALKDLEAFEAGGVNAVIFENNYDSPHHETISPESADFMARVGKSIKEKADLPVGISVLWNDYKNALETAKKLDLSFIRIPAFVDTVETAYGVMQAKADEAIEYRKKISAEKISLFVDIHVKHAKLLSPFSLAQSAQLAVKKGADALIVTGTWTGESPAVADLEMVRDAVGDFPIIVGSGLTAQNAPSLLSITDGAIVSTSLKEGSSEKNETNVKKYEQRISKDRVRALMDRVTQTTSKNRGIG